MAHATGAVALPTTVDAIPFARREEWSLVVKTVANIEGNASRRMLRTYHVFCRAAADTDPMDQDGVLACVHTLRDIVDDMRNRKVDDRAVCVVKWFIPLFDEAFRIDQRPGPVFDGVYAAAPEFECATHLLYHALVIAEGGAVPAWKIDLALMSRDIAFAPAQAEFMQNAIAKYMWARGRAPVRVLVPIDALPEIAVINGRRLRLTRAADAPAGMLAINVEEIVL